MSLQIKKQTFLLTDDLTLGYYSEQSIKPLAPELPQHRVPQPRYRPTANRSFLFSV